MNKLLLKELNKELENFQLVDDINKITLEDINYEKTKLKINRKVETERTSKTTNSNERI